MKGRRIIFQQTFPTGLYQNQKLGIEIDLDGNEEVDEVFAMAKKVVNDAFVALNPQIQWEQPSTLQASFSNEPTVTNIPVINKEAERIEIAIDNAPTKADLILLQQDSIKHNLIQQYLTKLKSFQ